MMQKKYSIEVDCANCAAAVERRVAKLRGVEEVTISYICLLYTSPSPRDLSTSRMPSSA